MSDHLHELIDDTLTYSEKEEDELQIDEYRSLRRALHTDILDVIAAEQSFFVIGSYDDPERRRLEATVGRLYNDGYAFLLDDAPDGWENWTTKFKIYADRATHIVGVFEHADGGHEWEAGYLDHLEYRAKTHILKRNYPSRNPKAEPFDGMMAHYMLLVDRRGQLFEWDGAIADSRESLEKSLLSAVEEFLDQIENQRS